MPSGLVLELISSTALSLIICIALFQCKKVIVISFIIVGDGVVVATVAIVVAVVNVPDIFSGVSS